MIQIVLIALCFLATIVALVKGRSFKNKADILIAEKVPEGLRAERAKEEKLETLNLMSSICKGVGAVASIATFALFISLSVFYVDKDEVGHSTRVYFGSEMGSGQIIARENQNGPQARIYSSGMKVIPFIRFTHDLEFFPVVEILPNSYGLVSAVDGLPLREGQFIADGWENYEDMMNAQMFLDKGQRGTQLTVLPPAKYRFNHYVFKVAMKSATIIKTGEVGVVRSNISEKGKECNPIISGIGEFQANLVPKGCKGVWNVALDQGAYNLNDFAYKVTKISTRVQAWIYKGGYTTRKIDITVDQNGDVTQSTQTIKVDKPDNAADKAINVRVEGWTVPVDLRVPVQISANNAPRVVAGIGTLQDVEDKIGTPAIRNILRTIGGEEGARVLDFVSNRQHISDKVKAVIAPITQKAGVTVLDVHLGEPAIPPELLVANQRNQIAEQLKITFAAEQQAQKVRIAVETERATADQQPELVKAKIAREAADELKEKRRLEGEGEKLFLTQLAEGEAARKEVLGEDSVVQLKMMEILAEHPELVKVPQQLTVVGNGASDLTAMGALLGGHSNIAKSLGAKVVK